MKLHVGCGETVISNWVNIDKFVKGKDIENIPIEKLPYPDNSVQVIYSSHMIEHLKPDVRDLALKEWYRVLIPIHGKLIIRCPYAPFYFNEWLNASPKEKLFIDNILGMQNQGEGMYNHGLYSDESLQYLLKQFGYKIQICKITTHRNPQLREKILKGILDSGEIYPNLEKRDIFCLVTK